MYRRHLRKVSKKNKKTKAPVVGSIRIFWSKRVGLATPSSISSQAYGSSSEEHKCGRRFYTIPTVALNNIRAALKRVVELPCLSRCTETIASRFFGSAGDSIRHARQQDCPTLRNEVENNQSEADYILPESAKLDPRTLGKY